MEGGASDAAVNDAQFLDYARRVQALAAACRAAAAADEGAPEAPAAESWMGDDWGEEEWGTEDGEGGGDSSGSERDASASSREVDDGDEQSGDEASAASGSAETTPRRRNSPWAPPATVRDASRAAEELFGDATLAPPSFGAPAAVAAAELATVEASKDALLAELVGMAAALKGEARALNANLVDQNKDLDKLSSVAELTSTQLGGEVRKLHAHFRRRLVAACGGLGMLLVVLCSFAAAVLFMRFFPKRWSVWGALATATSGYGEL